MLTQIVSGVYYSSNVVDDAFQDENRNSYVWYQGAQTLGIEKVVPSPDIPEAPASPCNIIHCKPINCESKLDLESPLAECDIDYLLKNQNAEVYRMRSPGQNGYRLPASPATTSVAQAQGLRFVRDGAHVARGSQGTTWQASQRVWLPTVAGPWWM